MTCPACEARIKKALCGANGVNQVSVSYTSGTATVVFDPQVVTEGALGTVVEQMDYRIRREGVPHPAEGGTPYRTIALLAVIGTLFLAVHQFELLNSASAFPLAEAGAGYAALFVLGLLTSLHCIAMCGGINLSQCIRKDNPAAFPPLPPNPPRRNSGVSLRVPAPALLYNGGRVISYTVLGGVVGALGSVITLTGFMKGMIQIAAGIFMVVMAVNMLNLFPRLRRYIPRLPLRLAAKQDALRQKGSGPFSIGLLNGLMPCGPLQAMQIYALSTGSPVKGALSMCFFALGTFPLTAFFGAVSSLLTGRFTKRLTTASACLIAVMGLVMLSYGLNLSGFDLNALAGIPQNTASGTQAVSQANGGTQPPVQVKDGYQIVASTLQPGRYPSITVREGMPVKWTISAPQGSINGCNNRMFIREYGIEHRFTPGENLITFTPARTGRFGYSCWMGMIRGVITVTGQEEKSAAGNEPRYTVVPAGVSIPVDAVAVAEKNEEQGFQQVTVTLHDDSMTPSLIVVERSVPAAWVINNDSLDEGNSALVFPAYYSRIALRQGENVIRFIPQEDFEFSTIDNVLYGLVKVVDDITRFDLEAVKADAAAWETRIYPDEYFEEEPDR
jgi:sulfite exporter TauE/SafE/copper chaperone CopZ/plastocyanin domain-containing protein